MSESAERFLVTGAGGCIGAWVATLLAREGAYVVGLDLDPEARRVREVAGDAIADSVTIERGDITAHDDIARALDAHAITNVIHLAALQIPFCRETPALGAAVNVVGTVNVFEAVRQRLDRIGGVVYAGSVALFGPDDGELVMVSEDGVGARPSTLYGVYKQANEGTARVYWDETAIPSIGLRPYTVYGPGRDQGVTSAPTMAIASMVRGERFTIPFGGVSIYNYAPDVAAACIHSSRALSEGAQVFNLPGSNLDMVEVIASFEEALPEARGLVDFDASASLPVPPELRTAAFDEEIGGVEITPFATAIAATVEHFRQTAG